MLADVVGSAINERAGVGDCNYLETDHCQDFAGIKGDLWVPCKRERAGLFEYLLDTMDVDGA